MKYTTQGNCPYCDAERGITTPWGMSPEGMESLRKQHALGHPDNQPEDFARMRPCECNLQQLCDYHLKKK